MAVSSHSQRPLVYLKQALRRCRAERSEHRSYATAQETYPSLQTRQPRYPLPTPGFRPSQAIRQNRFETGLKRIPVVPPPRSTSKACPDPVKALTESQIAILDPTGARTRLVSPTNPERLQPGDILLVRLRTGDPVSGVVLNIRQRHQPIDTAVLIRNTLTRVGVEMWFKIYSPNVEGMEVVQRKQGRRARRAKLYYMRQPKHDQGSVENVVKAYMRQRAGGPVGSSRVQGQRDAQSGGKKSKGKKNKTS